MLHITFFLLNRHSGMVDIVELFEKMEHGGVPQQKQGLLGVLHSDRRALRAQGFISGQVIQYHWPG